MEDGGRQRWGRVESRRNGEALRNTKGWEGHADRQTCSGVLIISFWGSARCVEGH